jgi:hypothetical protein
MRIFLLPATPTRTTSEMSRLMRARLRTRTPKLRVVEEGILF